MKSQPHAQYSLWLVNKMLNKNTLGVYSGTVCDNHILTVKLLDTILYHDALNCDKGTEIFRRLAVTNPLYS